MIPRRNRVAPGRWLMAAMALLMLASKQSLGRRWDRDSHTKRR